MPIPIEGSCDKREILSQCIDYFALGGNTQAIREACKVVKGTFGKTACPGGWLGTCTLGAHQARHYYGTGGTSFRAESAQKECRVIEGRWATRDDLGAEASDRVVYPHRADFR